jgi:glutamine amidotransferase
VTRVAVCDYGAGNVRSVGIAFERLGARVTLTTAPEAVAGADLAVLPGVGAAGSAMAALRAAALDEALRERVSAGRPTLGICLGLQLALERSEEDGGVDGLGLLPGTARRIDGPWCQARDVSAGATAGARHGTGLPGRPGPGTERVPRIGWAAVDPGGEPYYFAHSFAADTPAATAWSEGWVAEARTDAFVGVQFHPEKSGAAGSRWLERCLSPA